MDTDPILRILLVEPHPLRRDVLQEVLHGLEVDCMVADSASEGLWKLCAGHYDVVVLAEDLPDMKGAMAARVIRDGGAGQPVIIGLADDPQGRQSFVAAGVDEVLSGWPDLDAWRVTLGRINPRVDGGAFLDMAALDAWRDFQGQETHDAVVSDYLEAGRVAMARVRQQIARADAVGAAETVRVFGSHSGVVGARGLARACRELEAACLARDLRAAAGHLLRVQDDWLRVSSALEPQAYRMAG